MHDFLLVIAVSPAESSDPVCEIDSVNLVGVSENVFMFVELWKVIAMFSVFSLNQTCIFYLCFFLKPYYCE